MGTMAPLTDAELRRRWPRLLWAVRWACVLTDDQASTAILLHKTCAPETSPDLQVRARGGNLAVIRSGIRARHAARGAAHNCDRTRIRERALQAFWSVVAEGYPQVRHASLPYDAAIDLLFAADAAIDQCVGTPPGAGSTRR